jgi:hypothetical protein
MGKGIILRVPHGIELSPELLQTLGKRFPGYVLETYQEKPDYHRSFARRVDSLNKALSFLLDAYPFPQTNTPITKETLKAYANECKATSSEITGTVDELHEELEKFTAKLINTITVNWKCDVKVAIELLNEAEQYVLMSQGRVDLATLMPMKLDLDTDFVIQLDESLPSHYEKLLDELTQIKARKFPKTPAWFHDLNEYKQAYFCHLNPKIVTQTEVLQDINDFLLSWFLAKKSANNSSAFSADLKQIARGYSPLPVWFNELSPHQREMIRILAAEPSVAIIEKNLYAFKKEIATKSFALNSKGTIAQIPTIPQWYWVLPEHQQYFLEHVLKNSERVEDAVSFLSSRHRTLPLPANFAAHSLLAISQDGKTIRELSSKRYRSSHIASRDGLKWPKAVQQRHSDENLAKVMENASADQLALLQTLISPIYGADYVPNWLSDNLPTLPPDLELYKLARAAVERRQMVQAIQQSNHPYNFAKRIFYTQTNDEDSLAILAVAKKYAPSTPGLQTLLEQYKSVLESAIGSATIFDYAGRELFLSSLEQLIILTIGGYSYGSCVSGKDRKAIELIHTDAMILYKELYCSWPQFNEFPDKGNRSHFVNLVADLYMTRHQHEHAGQNAPGSEGIKTPEWYLPADIAAEINKRLENRRALEFDDRMATDNEVKNIFIGGSKKAREYLLPENTLLCHLAAKQLGAANCTKLYDALLPLINEKSLFVPVESSSLWSAAFFSVSDGSKSSPNGISQILELMHSPASGKDNVIRIEKILQIVAERPETDDTRTAATKSVYGRLRCILKAGEPATTFDDLVGEAVGEWASLFNSSKHAHLVMQ